MRVLLNDESLQEHIDRKVESHAETISRLEQKLQNLQSMDAPNTSPDPSDGSRITTTDANTVLLALRSKQLEQKWNIRLQGLIYQFLPQDRFRTVVLIVGLVVGGILLTFVFEFINEVLVASVAEHTMMDLRNEFFHRIIRMELSGFTQQGTSELMARFTNYMKSLGMGIEVVLGKVIREPLKGLGCLALAFWLNWRLTLVSVVLVPIALLVMSVIGNYMKRATRKSLETMASIYQVLQESFQGIKIVKAFTMEPYERIRFYRETLSYYRKAMRIARLEALTGPVMGLVAMTAVLAAALAGFYLVVTGQTHIWGIRMADHRMAPETMFMLFGFLIAASDPVRKVSGVYARVQKAAPAADRILNFMVCRPVSSTTVGAPRMPRHSRSIQFSKVTFGYSESRPVLKNISVEIPFGETVALVGPNGCGKTSMVSLLPRFYDPLGGQVLIDGVDVRHVQRRSLRRQFGVVTQETILFNDTIHNNIRYGNLRATREQVVGAAKKAYAHRFIEELPQGYETVVGEKAMKLSGGQRQRIAIARAILRDPAILILDEATSALDVESEALIQKVLEEFTRGRTTILITHRLASLQLADRIIVLNDGQIEAQGGHDELLKHCPLYARLHDLHLNGAYLNAS